MVERDRILTGNGVEAGDVLVGLAYNGLHTNGYSLARKLLFGKARYTPDTYVNEIKSKVGAELMRVHKSYWPVMRKLLDAEAISAAAHITGGGITENLPRVLPKGTAAVIQRGSWSVQPVFDHLQKLGNVPDDEMLRTFNMGIGMVLVVPAKKFKKAESILDRAGEKHFTIGRVVKGEKKVLYA
jgi:phosphoribosylformylglycinamidine cyclo-ligase